MKDLSELEREDLQLQKNYPPFEPVPVDSESDTEDLYKALVKNCYTIQEEQLIEFPPQQPVLKPWLFTDSVNMLHGPPGVGKTYIALATGISLAAGGSIVPGWGVVGGPYNVLFIDGEMNPAKLRQRKNELLAGCGLVIESIRGEIRTLSARALWKNDKMPLDLTLPEHRELVHRLITDTGTNFVVLDNLFCLIPGINIKLGEEYAPFNVWLNRLKSEGVIILFLHHDNKGGNFTGTNDMTFNLEERIQITRNQKTVKLEFCKRRENVDHLKDEFEFVSDENGTVIQAAEGTKESPYNDLQSYVIDRATDGVSRQEATEKWATFRFASKRAAGSAYDKFRAKKEFAYDEKKERLFHVG